MERKILMLFCDYCNKEKTKEALLVGNNMVAHYPENREAFEAYFDYLISLVQKRENDEAKALLQQATNLLAIFSEHVEMNDEVVKLILRKEKKLDDTWSSFHVKEETEKREKIREEVIYHNDALALLEQTLEKMVQCENENDFNVHISNLGKIDQCINREHLSSTQEKRYVELTKKSSEIVSSKMKYFEKIRNRDYNIKAIEAYEKVFHMFKNGKVIEEHKETLKSLFVFDASRLYNETLVYYNYVYNYVLNKLSDNDKFLMTKYAIMCEKER